MPTYQYRCTECGDDIEAVQKFSDAALTECPSCAGSLRKVYNAVGVVFRGSGFYRNDSRGPDNGAKDTAGSTSADKDSSSPETTTGAGSKPAVKEPASSAAASSSIAGSSASTGAKAAGS